jgi:thioredoxin reductase (NADPH)
MAERVMRHPKIAVQWNKVVAEILGADSVTGVSLRDTVTGAVTDLATDGVFVAIGHTPNTELFAGQLALDPKGYLLAFEGTATSVEGVFGAGDVVDSTYRQAVTAAGMGCEAAIDAERWLESKAHT